MTQSATHEVVIPYPRETQVEQAPSSPLHGVDIPSFLNHLGALGRGEILTGDQIYIVLLENANLIPSEHDINQEEQRLSALKELAQKPRTQPQTIQRRLGELGISETTVTQDLVDATAASAEKMQAERLAIVTAARDLQTAFEKVYLIADSTRIDTEALKGLHARTNAFISESDVLQFAIALRTSGNNDKQRQYAIILERFARFQILHTKQDEDEPRQST